ncbi:hypothetical protein CBR_g23416 [Chara braunii]|uniref:Uncharacterized protein n=1 Tax=Chara braunii TaxID=69332 RepID=A0A388L456_CHABU|nr:hypothetical protein CBR_g23416 [Chara braunii]|eukprot:GBG77090.1 hypothetical protein CBR_g23416 [Chara braunii]
MDIARSLCCWPFNASVNSEPSTASEVVSSSGAERVPIVERVALQSSVEEHSTRKGLSLSIMADADVVEADSDDSDATAMDVQEDGCAAIADAVAVALAGVPAGITNFSRRLDDTLPVSMVDTQPERLSRPQAGEHFSDSKGSVDDTSLIQAAFERAVSVHDEEAEGGEEDGMEEDTGSSPADGDGASQPDGLSRDNDDKEMIERIPSPMTAKDGGGGDRKKEKAHDNAGQERCGDSAAADAAKEGECSITNSEADEVAEVAEVGEAGRTLRRIEDYGSKNRAPLGGREQEKLARRESDNATEISVIADEAGDGYGGHDGTVGTDETVTVLEDAGRQNDVRGGRRRIGCRTSSCGGEASKREKGRERERERERDTAAPVNRRGGRPPRPPRPTAAAAAAAAAATTGDATTGSRRVTRASSHLQQDGRSQADEKKSFSSQRERACQLRDACESKPDQDEGEDKAALTRVGRRRSRSSLDTLPPRGANHSTGRLNRNLRGGGRGGTWRQTAAADEERPVEQPQIQKKTQPGIANRRSGEALPRKQREMAPNSGVTENQYLTSKGKENRAGRNDVGGNNKAGRNEVGRNNKLSSSSTWNRQGGGSGSGSGSSRKRTAAAADAEKKSSQRQRSMSLSTSTVSRQDVGRGDCCKVSGQPFHAGARHSGSTSTINPRSSRVWTQNLQNGSRSSGNATCSSSASTTWRAMVERQGQKDDDADEKEKLFRDSFGSAEFFHHFLEACKKNKALLRKFEKQTETPLEDCAVRLYCLALRAGESASSFNKTAFCFG